MTPEQIFLYNDDATFAVTLSAALTRDGIAVHTFADGASMLESLSRLRRGGSAVAVLQVATNGRDTALDRLIERHPDLPVVATIARPSVKVAVECMRRGAAYVLHAPFSPAQLTRTLRHVLAAPASASAARDGGTDAVRDRLAALSPRQKQILGQVFEGRINKVIAHRLGISVKTVELHRARMMAKMRATSAVELIRMTAPHSALVLEQAGS